MLKHIPNILTIIRLLLVPFFPIAYFSHSPDSHTIALVIFVIASATDFLDGYIAKKYNLITKIGTVLDPLADKLMLLTAIFTLYISGDLPVIIPIIVSTKEIFMILGGFFLYFRKEKSVIPANKIGKTATVLYTLAIFVTILFPASIASWILIISAILVKLIAISIYIFYYFSTMRHEQL